MHEEPLTLAGHTADIGGLAFSPSGLVLASASWDRSVRLWDLTTGKLLRTFRGDSPGFVRVAFSPDGQRLAAANWNGTVAVWRASALARCGWKWARLGVQNPLILASSSQRRRATAAGANGFCRNCSVSGVDMGPPWSFRLRRDAGDSLSRYPGSTAQT